MTHPQTDPHVAPREAWDAIATGYDRFVAPRESLLAMQALELAGLRTGDRFLDVAAGTGGLSLPAARLGARVVATDWSPKMIELFEARVREAGLTNAEGKVMDCHALDFPDATFDVTGSQFGVMLVPDQAQALREMVRVTRPGGRVLMIGYASPDEFEPLQLFLGAMQAVVPGFAGLPDPPPLEFQASDPEVLRRRMLEAGASEVTVHTGHREKVELRSGQELWDWCLGSNPIPGMLVADLNAEQRAQMRDALDASIRQRAGADGVAALTADLNIGVGRR